MIGVPDTPSRREADQTILRMESELQQVDVRVARVERKVDEIPAKVKEIIEEGDYRLPGGISPRDLLADHGLLHATNKRIIAALDGPLIAGLDGHETRMTEQGLVFQVTTNGQRLGRIEKILAEGVRTRWPAGVTVAIITACGAVVAAVVTALGPTLARIFG